MTLCVRVTDRVFDTVRVIEMVELGVPVGDGDCVLTTMGDFETELVGLFERERVAVTDGVEVELVVVTTEVVALEDWLAGLLSDFDKLPVAVPVAVALSDFDKLPVDVAVVDTPTDIDKLTVTDAVVAPVALIDFVKLPVEVAVAALSDFVKLPVAVAVVDFVAVPVLVAEATTAGERVPDRVPVVVAVDVVASTHVAVNPNVPVAPLNPSTTMK